MIQFNLLPDIKLEYIRAKKTKRTVILIAGLVSGVSFGLMLLLFLVVNVVQRTHMNNLDNDISQMTRELENTPDLSKVLTVQNQLNRINELHEKKPVADRLTNFITQVTPNSVTIAELLVSFENNTMYFKGEAPTTLPVNQFVDTLKFTNYKIDNTESRAFSNVVMRNYSRDKQLATYEIELTFDPAIFSSANNVELVVPKITTTRSVTEKPNVLFQPLNEPTDGQGE